MNKKLLIIIFLIISLRLFSDTGKKHDFFNFITSVYSTRDFSNQEMSDELINKILQAGNKAPSARNSQTWHFTVVTNQKLINEIMDNVTTNNVLIIVSGLKEAPRGINTDFDSALATQNMFLTAQALGLGSRIYTRPVYKINNDFTKKLSIPDEYRAISVLRIGYESDSIDATTSASPRNQLESKVNYIK